MYAVSFEFDRTWYSTAKNDNYIEYAIRLRAQESLDSSWEFVVVCEPHEENKEYNSFKILQTVVQRDLDQQVALNTMIWILITTGGIFIQIIFYMGQPVISRHLCDISIPMQMWSSIHFNV